MKKKFLLFAALIGALVLASCSGGNKKRVASSISAKELEKASQVVNYYHLSLGVLRDLVKEPEVNAVLGYMEQGGKAPLISPIVPPAVSAKDTTLLMHPGDCFDGGIRRNLIQNYAGLFQSRDQFYASFDTYLSLVKAKKFAEAGKLLNTSYRLSTEMSEYKQNIFDILSPATEQAEHLLLADEPLKDQMMSVRKMAATMQSIMNLYARPHVMDGFRLDLKMGELEKELNAAKELPAVSGHEEETKSYQKFLSTVEAFMKDVKKAREKGDYNQVDYDALIGEYGISII